MRVAVVVNPTKLDDGPSARLRAQRWVEEHTPGAVLDWHETTREDPGTGQARAALRSGADVVLAWGGDGTVRSVAAALADQAASAARVPLGLLPGGTGNLLARNLGLPLDLDEAAAVALTGRERAVDVLDLGLGGSTAVATVIAGIGLDSVLIDAPEQLKAVLGPMAYGLQSVRALAHPRMRVGVSVDGAAPVWRWARCVLVVNVGGLIAGLDVAPEAEPDDGFLDVVVLTLANPRDAVVAASSLVRRHRHDLPGRYHLRGRRATIVARGDFGRQIDGDVIDDGHVLDARVRAGALVVRVR
jgi:diacylglycerol kinase family enzyme